MTNSKTIKDFYQEVGVPLGILFLSMCLFRFIFSWLPQTELMKILRDLLTFGLDIALLCKNGYIVRSDFKVNYKLVITIVSGILLIAFVDRLLNPISGTIDYRLHDAVAALYMAPVIEEVICRKFVLDFFLPTWPILGVLIQANIFIWLHSNFDLEAVIFYVIATSYLTFARLRTKSVGSSMLIHAANNAIVLFV